MEHDVTQSMLDEKFPKGANVVTVGGGSPFNVPRFVVYNAGLIRCSSLEWPQEIDFTPSSIEDGEEEGTMIFKGATPSGYDVLVRQPPPAVQDALMKLRETVYTDAFVTQVGGS